MRYCPAKRSKECPRISDLLRNAIRIRVNGVRRLGAITNPHTTGQRGVLEAYMWTIQF